MSITKAQLAKFARLREYGCVICRLYPSIHHCETGMGRKKNHDKVIPLCYNHHQGKEGLHTLGRRKWESIFGTEQYWMERTKHI